MQQYEPSKKKMPTEQMAHKEERSGQNWGRGRYGKMCQNETMFTNIQTGGINIH